jgi:hypothetical protein
MDGDGMATPPFIRRGSVSGPIDHKEANVKSRREVYSWLRVSGTTKMPQIDHGVRHQFHTVMALLFELKAQQQPFEFILPCEGPLHA